MRVGLGQTSRIMGLVAEGESLAQGFQSLLFAIRLTQIDGGQAVKTVNFKGAVSRFARGLQGRVVRLQGRREILSVEIKNANAVQKARRRRFVALART